MTIKKQYEKLIGKTKDDVKLEIGQECNYFHDNLWTYNIKRNWLGKWIYLKVYFKDGKVTDVKLET